MAKESLVGKYARIKECNAAKKGSWAVGTIVIITGYDDYYYQRDRDCIMNIKNLGGKSYRSNYYSFSLSNLEVLTQEEVENIVKPKAILVVALSTQKQFPFDTNEEAMEKIGQLLKVNPAESFSIYELKGVAKTKEIPVTFTLAASL